MADTKISALPAASSVTNDDLIAIVDDVAGMPVTQKATIAQITQVYIDRAPAAPDNPARPALSYPTGGGSLQQWDVISQTWV